MSQVRLEVVTLRFPRVGTRGLPAHHTLLFLPRSPTGNETETQRKVCHLLIESRVLGTLVFGSFLSVYILSICLSAVYHLCSYSMFFFFKVDIEGYIPLYILLNC